MPAEEKLLPEEPKDLPTVPKELSAPRENSENPPNQVKTLLAWKAPGRPFRKRTKHYYVNTILISIVIEIILFLFSQYLLMLIVASLVFVSFALASVPPYDFDYKISTEGIKVEDHFFLWQELYDFYFKRHDGIDILHIRTHAFIPGELTITLGDIHKEQIKSVMLPYLPYREFVKPTFMEKSGEWLAKTFPLDKRP
ncbi:hypothetical protein M1307_03475 [Patescibacteria group bacterium]|nr:hypothetical protein [Patescibacteria group bacterium]